MMLMKHLKVIEITPR